MQVTPIEVRLASLHAHYVERINAAVAAGRMDLVQDLAGGYEDEALELMLDAEGDASIQPGDRTAEILEFGPESPHWQRWCRWWSLFSRLRRQ
jgi:hypothetical protein